MSDAPAPSDSAPPAELVEVDLTDQRPAMRILDAQRRRMGWSLNDLGEKSGVSVSSVCAWKHGRSPRLDNLVAIADALGFELIVRRRAE